MTRRLLRAGTVIRSLPFSSCRPFAFLFFPSMFSQSLPLIDGLRLDLPPLLVILIIDFMALPLLSSLFKLG